MYSFQYVFLNNYLSKHYILEKCLGTLDILRHNQEAVPGWVFLSRPNEVCFKRSRDEVSEKDRNYIYKCLLTLRT